MISVFKKSQKALESLVMVLDQLPDSACYSNPCDALSNATIGQHSRHIIELYQCLLDGYDAGVINYDDRERNALLENNMPTAIAAIKAIQLRLNQPDKKVSICAELADESVCIESNYYREVLYNLEHCIHHQALIKVALLNISGLKIADGFGVAPSTLQYRQQCAQ